VKIAASPFHLTAKKNVVTRNILTDIGDEILTQWAKSPKKQSVECIFNPVGKIAEKAVCGVYFLTITAHSVGDFAHWEGEKFRDFLFFAM